MHRRSILRTIPCDLKQLPIGAREAFVLSQVQGRCSAEDVAEVAGLEIGELLRVARRLVELGALAVDDDRPKTKRPSVSMRKTRSTAAPPPRKSERSLVPPAVVPVARKHPELRSLGIGPREGFVLSQIDGVTSTADLGEITGLSARDLSDALRVLETVGVVEIAGSKGRASKAPMKAVSTPAPRRVSTPVPKGVSMPAPVADPSVCELPEAERVLITETSARLHALDHYAVLDVERDNEHFRNAPRPLLVPAVMEARAAANGGQVLRTLIHMDDPEHKAFRAITASWFLPGRIRMLEGRIRELAVRYIDHMTDLGGSCDFAQEVAVGFPLHVILSILGLPEEDFPKMLQLTKELFDADDDEVIRSKDPAERMAMLLDFFQYFMALTADRRAKPTDDLASTIANATIEGQLLNDFDAASYYVIIATAGHDTTSSSIAGGLEALLRHPDQLARLRDDPSLGPTAVEEIIRWETPVKEFMRTAVEDRVIGGETIPAGDSVYLAYLSANRDEAAFEDPFRFDVGRTDNKHVAFGHGVHFCLGAHLARLELRIFTEELLARVTDIQFAGEPSRSATVFVGGLKHLPISYRVR